MKSNTWLILGGVGVVGYLYLSKKSVTTPSASSQAGTKNGHPYPPDLSGASYNNFSDPYDYFETTLYPYMVQTDPNLVNPSYTPTQAQCEMILQNYLDLRQALGALANDRHKDIISVVQDWWHTNGVPEKRTWLPLVPTSAVPHVDPPPNPNSSGSGSTWSTIGKVASIAAVFLGVSDAPKTELNQPLLNDLEVEWLLTGAAIALDLYPFYYSQPGDLALQSEDRMEALVQQYARK